MAAPQAATPEHVVEILMERYARRYCDDAGIRLADKPGPLYQLLVLATLLSARISADVAVSAARELFAAGYRSPKAMADASWQDRVDALGRGHYRRYDERTATMLGDGAGLLIERWHGDLRRLRDEALHDEALRDEAGGGSQGIASLLTEFPGIGPAGADIFLREVQDVWPSVAPHVDAVMIKGARKVGLVGSQEGGRGGTLPPPGREALAKLLTGHEEPGRLAAALVRVSLSDRAAGEVTAVAGR